MNGAISATKWQMPLLGRIQTPNSIFKSGAKWCSEVKLGRKQILDGSTLIFKSIH
jgi:hypothetical protein